MSRLAVALSLVLASIGLFLTAPVATACSVGFSLYDNPNYQIDVGEAVPLVRCYNNSIPNLNDVPFLDVNGNQGSWCGSSLIGHNTWDNCASSWKFAGSCHYGVVAYLDPNYSGSILWSTWGNRNFPGGFGYEDSMTSFRFTYRITCPSSPG